MLSVIRVLAAGLCALGAAGVSAQTIWNFGDQTAPGSCAQVGANQGTFGNTYACSEQPDGTTPNLEVRAFANSNSGGTFATAHVNYWGTGSGIGVQNRGEGTGSPNHSMDNSGYQDVLLLKFTEGPVALNSIRLGWWQTDSDLTILRWTGAGTPDAGASNITNQTVATMLTSGWSLMTSISNAGTTERTFNAGNLTSSYWLVSAFNSTWNGGGGDSNLDYVKVVSVGAFVPKPPGGGQVAEPATLALVGLAMLGLVGGQRRRRLASAA